MGDTICTISERLDSRKMKDVLMTICVIQDVVSGIPN